MDANVGGSEPNGLTRQGGDAVLAKCAKDGGKGRKGGTALRARMGKWLTRSRGGWFVVALGDGVGRWWSVGVFLL